MSITRRYPILLVWLFSSFAMLFSSWALGLWATRKVLLYEVALVMVLGLWVWQIVPKLSLHAISKRRASTIAIAVAAGYFALNFLLSSYSIMRPIRIKGDFGVFIQSLWWTLHGLPLFNTMDGTSHLGVHASFLLYALVPLYAVWSSPLMLVFVQAIALAAAGLVFFKIAQEHLDSYTSLLLLITFLLFPAYQYGFGDFYESSLAAPLVLLTIDSALKKRWLTFGIWSILLAGVKETFPLMLVALGVYLFLTRRARIGLASILVGAVWFLVDMGLIIPWFRSTFAVFPTDFQHLAPFAQFGTSPEMIVANVITHPMNTILIMLQPGKPEYLLSLVAPYLFLGSFGSLVWIAALPELAITLLSNHPDAYSVLLGGARFSMVVATTLALSVVFTLSRLKAFLGQRQSQFHILVGSSMFFSTLGLMPLWLNSTALVPLAGATELQAILGRVGPNVAIAVPYEVVAPFAQRAVVFDIDRNPVQVISGCAEYVVMRHDPPERQLFASLSASGFRQVWSGEEFELWQALAVPNCSPSQGPWVLYRERYVAPYSQQ
jgi:uncharacterized membrane protein